MLDVRDGYYGELAVETAKSAQASTLPHWSADRSLALAQVYATLELAVQIRHLRP